MKTNRYSAKQAASIRNVLLMLDLKYLSSAFTEGLRTGAMEDGHYSPVDDLSFVLAYCQYGGVS